MIDIHNHLLYGIDDGSKSLESTIDTLKDLEILGYNSIILTPHYIKNSKYNSNKSNNIKILRELKKEVKKNNININLYLGNEIFYDDDIYELLNNKEISSLNNTEYLLIELPMSGEVNGYEDVFNDLLLKGYKVILAHPERYLSFQKDYSKINDLYDMGILFQCNIESIIDSYGKNAHKVVKKLLKEGKVSYLATDIHHKKKDYSKIEKSFKKIKKIIKEDEFDKLINVNPSHLID